MRLSATEARIIDEAPRLLGPSGERWIQGSRADGHRNDCKIGAIRPARHRPKAKGDDTNASSAMCSVGTGIMEGSFSLAKCEAIKRTRQQCRLNSELVSLVFGNAL
jgi:hypothetical protein